jgi:zinc transport system substrate-binding protein
MGRRKERLGIAARAVAACAILLLLSPAACRPPARESGRVPVVASIPPLADIAAEVGGDEVEVTLLVPPGASPHTFEPSPSQLRAVSHARLLVLNGVGLEYWADKVVGAAENPDLVVVDASRRVPVVGRNPHVWLDPAGAALQAEEVRDALVAADPPHRAEYEANAAAFEADLRALDAEIRARVAGWSRRSFVSLHPAWSYFARRYGLVEAAVIEESPGREPSAAEMVRIVETCRRSGAQAVFAEPQLSSKAARVLAEEAGIPVAVLDPLGPGKGKGGYRELMMNVVAGMEEALR